MQKRRAFHPVLAIVLLTLFFLGLAYVFEPQFTAMGEWVLTRYGLPGLYLATFLQDFLPQPFPPDVLLYSAVLSGADFWMACLGVGLMSVAGGCAGYWAGVFLQHEGAAKVIGKKRFKLAHKLFEEHGGLAVLIGALSPVPFNVVCWSAGVFGMSFRRFLISALLTRLPRYVVVGFVALSMGFWGA